MIFGIVADGHAIITIPFRIPNRTDFSIEFVVDTGFTDELCLPPEAVALLNLPFKYDMRTNLADTAEFRSQESEFRSEQSYSYGF